MNGIVGGAISMMQGTMLLLSNDSGYNSPCGGVEASSSFESPCFFSTRVNLKRKLCFASPSTSPGKESCGLEASQTVCPRAREIAQRLLLHCDSFDNEFTNIALEKQECAWITATFRYLSSWL
ncbi:hypothetical protein OSTOST_18975 [Ostertagia ostertagi]